MNDEMNGNSQSTKTPMSQSEVFLLIAAALQRVLQIAYLCYFYLLVLKCLSDELHKVLHLGPRAGFDKYCR